MPQSVDNLSCNLTDCQQFFAASEYSLRAESSHSGKFRKNAGDDTVQEPDLTDAGRTAGAVRDDVVVCRRLSQPIKPDQPTRVVTVAANRSS